MSAVAVLTEPLSRVVNQTRLTLLCGDLTDLAVDAVVFYAQQNLDLGSGFGTAVQTRGGDSIRKELEKLGGVRMGEAVLTGAGRLKARWIIHACGPKFQEPETGRKFDACMKSALKLAAEKGLQTVAFPPMGAGFYGVPLDRCAQLMVAAIKDYLRDATSLQEITICAIDRREYEAFRPKLEGL